VDSRPSIKHLTLDQHVATFLGVGLLPLAPGTWASLVIACVAWFASPSMWAYAGFAALAAFSFFVGWRATQRVQEEWGTDPSVVVVDEVCGMALVYSIPLASSSISMLIAGFLVFRMYDIAKPWPINLVNARTDAFSVMFDDVLAAIYTIFTLYIFQFGVTFLFLSGILK